ncbi:MAG: hypothetical protein ACTSQA_00310 [Candidatus Heimdallarchaeaceae archaeon]
MEKRFRMMKDHLEVTVTHSDEINLPIDGKSELVGTANGTQIQKINPDKIPVLVKFLENDLEQGKGQLEQIDKQLKTLGDTIDLDDKIVEACSKQIGKGTKVFKQKMLVLNNHLEKINKVKNLRSQKEFLETRVKPAEKELADLKKAIE